MTSDLIVGLLKVVIGVMCVASFLLGYVVCAFRYEKKAEAKQ